MSDAGRGYGSHRGHRGTETAGQARLFTEKNKYARCLIRLLFIADACGATGRSCGAEGTEGFKCEIRNAECEIEKTEYVNHEKHERREFTRPVGRTSRAQRALFPCPKGMLPVTVGNTSRGPSGRIPYRKYRKFIFAL